MTTNGRDCPRGFLEGCLPRTTLASPAPPASSAPKGRPIPARGRGKRVSRADRRPGKSKQRINQALKARTINPLRSEYHAEPPNRFSRALKPPGEFLIVVRQLSVLDALELLFFGLLGGYWHYAISNSFRVKSPIGKQAGHWLQISQNTARSVSARFSYFKLLVPLLAGSCFYEIRNLHIIFRPDFPRER